jgi:hypothetical protein
MRDLTVIKHEHLNNYKNSDNIVTHHSISTYYVIFRTEAFFPIFDFIETLSIDCSNFSFINLQLSDFSKLFSLWTLCFNIWSSKSYLGHKYIQRLHIILLSLKLHRKNWTLDTLIPSKRDLVFTFRLYATLNRKTRNCNIKRP